MSSGGIGPDGKIYCKHSNEEAVKRKSNTSKHPNRDFYCCKRSVASKSRCDFFLWADESALQSDSTLVGASTSGPSTIPTIPRPLNEGASVVNGRISPFDSQRSPLTQSALPNTTVRSVPASPTRLPDRHFRPSLSTGSLLATPQSRQRLKDIKIGLQQRKQDLSPTHDLGVSEEAGPVSTSSGIEAIPQPPSPVPTEIDDAAESGEQPVKSFRSFLGLSDYGPQPSASVKDEGQPPTPKKRRLTPPTGDTGKQPAVDAVSSDGKLPLTPPQTTHRKGRLDKPKQVSSASSSRKGKERERTPSTQARDQIQYDPVTGCSGELQEEDSLPLFTNAEDGYSSSSASPTIADNVLDYTNGVKARVKGLSEYMDSFEIENALKALQSVERQKMQYECRDRSQKKRMDELVAENDKLVGEVSSLKEALQRSEASNRTKDAEIEVLRQLRGHD